MVSFLDPGRFPGPTLGQVGAAFIPPTVPVVVQAIRDFQALIQGADELLRSFPKTRALRPGRDPLEGISGTAGRLLLDAGAVQTLDQGILLFHQELSRDKPGLRRVFNRIDRRQGRLPPVRGQAELVAKGFVRRGKGAALQKLSSGDRRRIAKAKGISLRTKEIVLGKPLTASSRAKAIAKRRRR